MPNFKAHTYGITPKSGTVSINTDNKPYLGEEPYLVYKNKCGDEAEIKMEKNKDLYSAELHFYQNKINYHIKYKDTNATDSKNGKDYSVDISKLMQTSTELIRNQYHQPLIQAFKKGTTVGKILYKDKFEWNEFDKINEPSILVTKTAVIPSLNNNNILGFLLTDYDMSVLGHHATNLRQETNVSAAVLDKKNIEKLKSLNGKNVEITVNDDFLSVKETDKKATVKTFPKIDIPEMEYCNRILTSKEYSPKLVGAKAVNLRRLEELVENGTIDVKIPKSLALPYGFIENNFSEEMFFINEKSNKQRMNKLLEEFKDRGINTKTFMVRSAFNGEDLTNYSAAGLYNTCISNDDAYSLYECVKHVERSKNYRKTIDSRKRHGIPDDKIKPSIIIQDRIKPDYSFTLYTEYDKDNLRIDMHSGRFTDKKEFIQPHVFNYDRKNKKLSYDSIQLIAPMVTYDENLNIINLPPVEGDLSNDKKLFKQIQKLVDNALVIEKEFGAPQDIEGGLLGDDIYLWQTRNIVK